MRIHRLDWVFALTACACAARGGSADPDSDLSERPRGVPSWDVSGELDPIHAAVTGPRDARDVARDEIRHPEQLLRFAGVEPGMRVADLGTGPGYTAALLACVVGIRGKVWAQNPPEWEDFGASMWKERKANGRFPNVTLVQRGFDDPLPGDATELDLVLSVLVYHDTAAMGVDRTAMNAAVARALRDDGVYVVVDHCAAEGAGTSVAADLHRIERSVVVAEIESAGFELVDEAHFLHDPNDDHAFVAWADPQPVTDRFVLAFRKRATG